MTQLEATATDDALELLELLMATELAARAPTLPPTAAAIG